MGLMFRVWSLGFGVFINIKIMSFASLGSSILRNNRRIRSDKKSLFEKEEDGKYTKFGSKKPKAYKHLSQIELKSVREEVADTVELEKKNRITALAFSLIITTVIVIFAIIYIDQIFEALRSYYNDSLAPKYW